MNTHQAVNLLRAVETELEGPDEMIVLVLDSGDKDSDGRPRGRTSFLVSLGKKKGARVRGVVRNC